MLTVMVMISSCLLDFQVTYAYESDASNDHKPEI